MAKSPYKTNITEFDNLDLELFFLTEILKLNSLHYGYWDENQSITLENLKVAQIHYTNTLISMIPMNVKNILDVGSGIGDVSSTLAKKNYTVTAISPDKNHQKFFSKYSTIKFHNERFEDLNISDTFDCILMSESQNYIDTQKAFSQCDRYLNPKGYLLVSGIFRKNNSKEFNNVTNIELEYIEKAKTKGFNLIEKIDITKNTLPTLDFAFIKYNEYFTPTLHMIKHYLTSSAPLKLKILKFFFKKQLNTLKKINDFYIERLNSQRFFDYTKYLRLLFQKST